jgi:hypothetical protein
MYKEKSVGDDKWSSCAREVHKVEERKKHFLRAEFVNLMELALSSILRISFFHFVVFET